MIYTSQGYKYGSVIPPFGDAVKPMLESPQIAIFAEQGEVIGKTKGRKKRTAEGTAANGDDDDDNGGCDDDVEKPARKRPKQPKAKAKGGPKKSARVAEPAGEEPKAPSPEEVPSRKSKGGKKPEVEVPPLASLVDPVTPPAHVNTGAVYSNAYRKYQSAHGKGDTEGAKKAAQLASAIFQEHGVVPKEYVGNFLAKPRRKVSDTPTPQQKAEGEADNAKVADTASPEAAGES